MFLQFKYVVTFAHFLFLFYTVWYLILISEILPTQSLSIIYLFR